MDGLYMRRKKGTTLLELVVYIGSSVLILSMAVKVLMLDFKVYNERLLMEKDTNDIEQLFLIIEKNCSYFTKSEYSEENNKAEYVEVNHIGVANNKLVMEYELNGNFNRRKELLLENKELHLKYFECNDFAKVINNTIIARNIDSFSVKQKGNVIYLTIQKNGKVYRKLI